MKKIRCGLATLALVTLGGLSLLQGMAAMPLANVASSHSATSASASSMVGKSVAFSIKPPCGSSVDC